MFNIFNKSKHKDEEITVEQRLKGSLFGFFVGDALGVPVEFVEREKLSKSKVTDMIGYGTHSQPKGTWSDDSSMTIATIDSINKNKNIIYDDIMNNYTDWYFNGNYTPFGKVFDCGGTTGYAIKKYSNNKQTFKCGATDINSNGNGSLMRILPISLFLHYFNKDIYDTINNISSMTHAHAYSVFGCYIYTIYVNELIINKNKKDAYFNMQKIVLKFLDDNKELEEKFGLNNAYSRLLNNDISVLSEEEIKSSGYVIDTLEAAIWCLLTTNSYDESVLKAVNLGDDTDTVAAINGGLAGLIYGYDNIPTKWINSLHRKDYLDDLVTNFINIIVNNKDIDINLLDDAINTLKNDPNACGYYKEGGSFYCKELENFINHFSNLGLSKMDYLKILENAKAKNIEEYTYEETLASFTRIIRGERFSMNFIYNSYKNGILLKTLERLRSLINK